MPEQKTPPVVRSTLLPSPVGFVGGLPEVAAEYIQAVTAELEEAHWSGAPGADTSVRYTSAADNLLRFIFEAASERFSRRYARAHQRCAVLALGSYGRRELNPKSDWDILVVYPTTMNPYVETVAESLCYTLWDAGIQVGHAVRSFKQCAELAAKDLTIKTSILDGRFVCGSTELAGEFVEKVQNTIASADPDGFVDAKVRESEKRHGNYGGSIFMLEPNIKEGQGGLRDLHTALWIARVKHGIQNLEGLVEHKIVSQTELVELMGARDFLLRARNSLHFLTGSKQDNLTFERQEAIGERCGYGGENGNTAGELFMRDYYSNAALIWRVSTDLINRLVDSPQQPGLLDRLVGRTVREKVKLQRGRLAADESLVDEDPVNLIRIMHDAQRLEVDLSSSTREMLRRKADLLTPEIAESKAAVAAFFDILKWKTGVFITLAQMNRLGVLGRLIPEFGRLFCMVQHDFYHVYTVDEHSLIGVRELERLRDGEFMKDSPLLTQIMRECDHPELLFLAMMLHDLGKGYGGDHDEKGALMVKDIAKRLRINHDDRRALEFLVRYHLNMSMLAQTRDIEDDMLVADFVELVGTYKNLTYLYLLTFADMRAVGPKVWSGWKDNLLSELYRRASEMFDTGLVTERDLTRRAERARKRAVKRAAADNERERIESFVGAMPDSYMLSTSDETVVDHWRLVDSLGTDGFTSGVVHFPERGFSEFTVCTRDLPGAFVRITGVLLAHGLNVIGARIVTSSDGVALDVFRIDHQGSAEVAMDPEVWTRAREGLQGVLEGRVDVDILVAEVRAASERSIATRQVRRMITRVEIDNDVSKTYTVIDLYTSDRLGVLFTVVNCIYHLGMIIHLAKITTQVDRVLDVFYVTDAEGRKITSADWLEEIRTIIVETLDGSVVEPTARAQPA